MKRFDRLRLYLCEKNNFEDNQPFEIISESSSDEELPELTFQANMNSKHRGTLEGNTENGSEPGASLTTETKHADDTLPLTTDVIFHYGDKKILETFPNNTKGGALKTCVERHLGLSCSLFELQLRGSDTLITSNDRLMELGSSSTLNINILEHQQSETELQNEIDEDDIPADIFASTSIVDSLVKATLKSLEGISDPLIILRKYQENFLRGRPLDVVCESETIEGETSAVFVSRSQLFEDAIQEIKFRHNIRFPLEVFFHGEAAQDLGGPRREFFVHFIAEMKERLVIEKEEKKVCLTQNDEDLALHRYFYAGLLLGLCIIEGGPTVNFLDSLLKNSTGEVKDQFISGLSRTGIMQLINETKTVRYLFIPSTKTEMTVNSFLHLFKPDFSELGTSRRVQEENAYGFFIRYLREVYSGRRGNITLNKVLKFATGASDMPVLGFTMEPSIDFADIIFPQASTCINRLTLPTDQKDYSKFDLAFANDFFGME